MSKFFIDCGGNDGCSVRKFRNLYDDCLNYKIYSFEANSVFFDCYKDFENHELIKKLVWIEDGFIDFYIDGNLKRFSGSTIFKEKALSDKKYQYTKIKAETINFSFWLLNNFKTNDEIILKMDIEGAEYKVLDKMIQDKSIELIKKLYVEWHWNKINLSKEIHNEIVNKIKGYVDINHWDAFK